MTERMGAHIEENIQPNPGTLDTPVKPGIFWVQKTAEGTEDHSVGSNSEGQAISDTVHDLLKHQFIAPPEADKSSAVIVEPVISDPSEENVFDNFQPSSKALEKLRNFKPVTLEYVPDPEQRAEQEDMLRAIDLKGKYFFGLQAVYSTGINSPVDAEILAAMPYIGNEIMRDKTFVTDVARGNSENFKPYQFVEKYKQDQDLIKSRLGFLSDMIGEEDLPECAELRMQDILGGIGKFCEGKTIYAQDGLDSILDLLRDGMLSRHTVERQAVNMLLVDGEIRDLLHKNDYYRPESPDRDTAEHLGVFLMKLDQSDRDFVIERYRQYEETYGQDYLELVNKVDNIIGLNEFTEIDIDDPEKLPTELQVLIEENPQMEQILQELSSQGVFVSLKKQTGTNKDVIESIHNISTMSQENYTQNWLKPFVSDKKRPLLQMTENGKVKAEQMKSKNNEKIDLETELDTIEKSIDGYLKVVATSEIDHSQQKMIDTINSGLDQLRRDWAANRMQFDLSNERDGGVEFATVDQYLADENARIAAELGGNESDKQGWIDSFKELFHGMRLNAMNSVVSLSGMEHMKPFFNDVPDTFADMALACFMFITPLVMNAIKEYLSQKGAS